MMIELIKHAVAQPSFVVHGVRKIIQGIHWTEPTLPNAMDIITELGYGQQKVTRLRNIYYNEGEVAAAKAKLAERVGEEHSSASILMRNMSKDSRSQGHCIQNIVISETWRRKERFATADIFYRSTELIQKFGADISLIKSVFDELEVTPSPVRFYFSNAYVSAVFFPILFQKTDGVAFLEHIREHDENFWWLASKAVSRYLDPDPTRYSYQAQVKQWKRGQSLDRKPLDEYLMKMIPEYHRDHLGKKSCTPVSKTRLTKPTFASVTKVGTSPTPAGSPSKSTPRVKRSSSSIPPSASTRAASKSLTSTATTSSRTPRGPTSTSSKSGPAVSRSTRVKRT
jgi:hypothetical protein